MKKLFLLLLCLAFVGLAGCASNTNFLQSITQNLTPYVDTLAIDWPKASGVISGAIRRDNLPKIIVDDLEEIDSWWKDKDGNWIPEADMKLNTWQKWYIAGVRYRHTGAMVKALFEQHAPGLLLFPETMAIFSFLGL